MNQILKKTFAGLCLISSLLLTPSAALSAPTATIFSLATGVAGVTTGRLSGGGSALFRPESLSQSASNRNFAAQSFTPSVTDTYTFGVVSSDFDAVLVLYDGPFDPSSPRTFAMAVNDDRSTQPPAGVTVNGCDGDPDLCPQLTQTLTAGTTYTVVVTTYSDITETVLPVDFYVYGEPVTVGAAPSNAAPVASSVLISGTPQTGTALGSSYGYGDADGDAEGASTFRWVRNSTNTGVSGGSTVGTSATYTPVTADVGAYMYFCVTPVATAGTSTGTEACSTATAAVIAGPVNGVCGTAANTAVSILPSNNLCTAGTAGQVSSSQGQYSWTCSGTGGGTNASCAAPWATNAGTGSGSLSASGNGWTVSSASFAATPTATPPAGVTFPNGLLDLRLSTGSSGTDATVVVQYTTAVPAGAVYMKYGKTAANQTDHWYQLDASRAVFASDRMSVTLTLTDGGAGDHDLLANGTIVDPGGPALVPAPTAVPTLSEWAMIFLASLMGLFAFARIRRQS
jgi:hypothetical protein